MIEHDDWHRSTFCNPCCNNCVEVRSSGHDIEVRDSKDPTAGTLRFTQDEWTAFVAGVKAGEFDR
ncbi:MAG: DUF397 domain-containing protein [Actinomycetota bacterium]